MNQLMHGFETYSPRRCARIEQFIYDLQQTAEENDGQLPLDKKDEML